MPIKVVLYIGVCLLCLVATGVLLVGTVKGSAIVGIVVIWVVGGLGMLAIYEWQPRTKLFGWL